MEKERKIKMNQPTIFLLANEPYNEAETKLINYFENLVCQTTTPKELDKAKFRKIKNEKDGDYWVFHSNISIKEFHQVKGKVRAYTHPVVFNLIVKENAKGQYCLVEVGVIDDMFGQPHFTNDEYNQKIFNVCEELIEKGIFVLKTKK